MNSGLVTPPKSIASKPRAKTPHPVYLTVMNARIRPPNVYAALAF